METVPVRQLNDRVRVMNTPTAERLGLVGRRGIVVRVIGPAKWGGERYEIEDEAGERFECDGSILGG